MINYEILNTYEIQLKEKPVHGASYITPDGLYIDMSEAYKIGVINKNGYGVPLHMDLDRICVQEFNPTVCNNVLKHEDNAIKIQDGALIEREHPYIDLPDNDLTDKQYDALELWLFMLSKSNKKIVFVKFNNKNDIYDLSQVEPKDVLDAIKRTYKEEEPENVQENN